MDKPRIINGICEFCGIPAYQCQHYKGLVDISGKAIKGAVREFEITTPKNCNKANKKILIGCVEFESLTGMPMYILNLGKAMINLGYEIHVVSTIGGVMKELGENAGFRLFDWSDKRYQDEEYIALILNEPISAQLLDKFPNTPAYNIIHSARIEDEPIPNTPQIRKYLCSKKSDYEYTLARVPKEKIGFLDIPIDFSRFEDVKKKEKKVGEPYTILSVSTFDQLRFPMLKNLVKRAKDNKNIKVILKGNDNGISLNGEYTSVLKLLSPLPENVIVDPNPSYDLKELFEQADEVAGIFFGTITLEAWSCDKITSIYDEHGNYKIVKRPDDFIQRHKAINVAKKLHNILNEKWADIIVPHHDRPNLLSNFLQSVPIRNYNVIVYRGGSFAEACNRGAILANTNTLIFSNDDIVLNPKVLWEMVDRKKDLVGVKQIYPTGEDLCLGIYINEEGWYQLSNDPSKVIYPSGALFKITRHYWELLNGFDERFINGGEDQDLGLRALESGASIGFIESPVVHYCSKSTGRFDYIKHNDNLFFKLWNPERLKKVLGDKYNVTQSNKLNEN